MFKDRLDYIRHIFAPETDALKSIRTQLVGQNDQISIHPEEGKLLQVLIRLGGIRTVVEIGTLAGYSALWMADALPDDGKMISIEKDDARYSEAKKNIGAHNKIDLRRGDALKILPDLSREGPFDMVFIDADKLNYLHYLDWAEQNVRKGGVIVGDNTFLFDAVWKEEIPDRVRQTALHAMRAFNLRLSDPGKYTGIMLPTAEGLTIAQKNF